MKHKYILINSLILSLLIHFTSVAFAQNPPSSTNYKIVNYGFGGGGIASSSSTNYSLFGTLGQVDQGSPSSANYFIGAGLEFTLQASVPATPTFVNSSNWYNKLKLTINRGGNDPADYKYAIAIASGSGQFQYVQNDNTVGDALGLEDWQTYSSWGGASGTTIIGLYPGTLYTAKVAAKQGDFYTNLMWGPTAQATTENPTLIFDIDVSPTDSETAGPYTVNIGNLSPATVTAANDKVWVDLTTNANSGGVIYVQGTNTGLESQTALHTINTVPAKNDLGDALEGYGAQYNTLFATSGNMEVVNPYDGTGTTVGVLDTAKRTMFDSTLAPVTGGRVSFTLKAKASNTTPSATDYADTLTVIATGNF